MNSLEIQGHRGARGLKPENTLPSFEAALDHLATALETDIHLTKDGALVLHHDERLRPARPQASGFQPEPRADQRPLLSQLSLAELRGYLVDGNPDPGRFREQNNEPTPAATTFCTARRWQVFQVPTLPDLLEFVAAYAGDLGIEAGKTDRQRENARRVRFNLEPKRVPFWPEFVGDHFDGHSPGQLETRIVEAVRAAQTAERTTVQCFDHRVVRAIRRLEPRITGAVLTANTAPVAIVPLVQAAEAQVYSPEFTFLDARQIEEAHAAGVRVVPYTVNELADMRRLLDWGVDGMVTDYPDRLHRMRNDE